MKVALVYDRVNKWGGAERVLLALHEIWPQAPLFTSLYNPQTASWAQRFKVVPSFLNRLPCLRTRHQLIPFLMPLAFESFNFDEFDVVISVTSEFAKGIITKPQTLHLCYCLTPTRYLWSSYDEYFSSSFFRLFGSPVVSYLRNWDQIAAQRVDEYLAISNEVKRRINRYYGRESAVVYPGVNIEKFKVQSLRPEHSARAVRPSPSVLSSGSKDSPSRPHAEGLRPRVSKLKAFDPSIRPERFGRAHRRGLMPRGSGRGFQSSKFFLVVSRMVRYKRVDLVIKAFNQLGWSLKIVGTGRELKRLKRMVRGNIEFLGQLTEEELISYYQNCRALIMPQKEDFGLVALEAQAAGKPIIAYRSGGAREIIIDGKTGIFFAKQTTNSLIKALNEFENLKFKEEECRQQAEKFDVKIFKKQFKEYLEEKWRQHEKN